MRNRDLAFQLRGIARSDRVNHQEKRVLNEAAARIHPYARQVEYKDLTKSEGALWVEFRNSEKEKPSGVVLGLVVSGDEKNTAVALRERFDVIILPASGYNVNWRCWRGKPSEEQTREEWE